MKYLMLRGQVPIDRDPKEIVFEYLEDIDDVWTQLFYAILDKDDEGELWYWGGTREKKFTANFVERWVPNYDQYKTSFIPDVIFCRGGFPEYHVVLRRFPNSIKIYYGAGRRFLPQPGFYDYDIILQDSPEQVLECREKFPKALTTLFIKPAADNIFYPMPHIKKEYDICFPANAAQTFKGHKFVYDTVPSDMTLLNLGNRNDRYKYPANVTSYRVLRPKMAENIAKCKVGIVAVQSEIDSCPRVIPEMLACGIPIVALDRVRFWRDKYIVTSVTGELTTLNKFWIKVRFVLDNLEEYVPRKYYENNLSLDYAARFIKEKINEVSI